MKTLQCIKCSLEKELNEDNFYYRKDTNKWRPICKECISNQNKSIYEDKSEEIKERTSIYREANRNKINNKAIIYNNKPEVKLRTKLYRQENKKSLREKEKEWRLNNPEKYKAIVRRKSKKQRQKPTSKIKAHVSRQIGFALHRQGASKQGNSVLKFLPYSIQELRMHLERQFETWMTWDNYGRYKPKTWNDLDITTWTWQIDHIIPQSDSPYANMNDDNFQKCWTLENLRPLNAKVNAMDGATRVRHSKEAK